jgi:spore maturation protein CgeB
MKILVYRWKSYNYRDVTEGFAGMGGEVFYLEGEPASYDEDPVFFEGAVQRIREVKPDFLFTINYFGVLSDACEDCGVPYVAWTCDSCLISMSHRSITNSCNRLFFFDKGDMERVRLYGAPFLRHLPLGTDPVRSSEMLKGTPADRLSEVAFIGSLYEKNTYDELEGQMDDYLKGYLDAAIEAQLAVSGGNLFDVLLTPDILFRIGEIFTLEKTEGSFSDLALVFSSTVLGFKAASEMRIRALSALSARFDTVLYSNSPAEGLPIRRLPSVDYWTKAPEVFRRSAVNLNFTIPNIRTGLPLRIYDVLAARGFLMTDYRAELAEQFEIGKELVCYESIPELEEKCAYYLKHEEERKKIAENGYERVNKDHRIGKRLEVLLRELSI